MLRYRLLVGRLHRVGDLALVAGCKDIYAQSLLMAGRVARAKEAAREVQELYEQLQYFNGIGLGERTCSWIALAMEDVADARRRLGRSVMVGTYSADASLLPKFVVSLLRVAAAEAHVNSASRFLAPVTGDAPGLNDVEQAARWFYEAPALPCNDSRAADYLTVLGSWSYDVYTRTGECDYIREQLDRYGDVRRFPIFLITDPSPKRPDKSESALCQSTGRL